MKKPKIIPHELAAKDPNAVEDAADDTAGEELDPCELQLEEFNDEQDPKQKRIKAIDLSICRLRQANRYLRDNKVIGHKPVVDANINVIADLKERKAAIKAVSKAFPAVPNELLTQLAHAVEDLETCVARSKLANDVAKAANQLVTAITPLTK